MFDAVINVNKIPPNFINSILTNPSLYDMFKNEYDANIEYFQNISKNEYLHLMLKFIEDTLFSSNIFHIYTDVENIEEYTQGKLKFIRQFYDDFILIELNKLPENILNTRFFRGLEFTKKNDLYASVTSEFNDLYNYVFKESLDYFGIVDVLLSDSIKELKNKNALSIHDFDLVCNYVKNNINGFIDMDLIAGMLHNHAYKTNHIFDPEVIEKIVSSVVSDYASLYGLTLNVAFPEETQDETQQNSNVVIIDYQYIDGFISLNYVELFENVFFEVNKKIAQILLQKNECNYLTFKNLVNLLVYKVDLNRVFKDPDYKPQSYLNELHASSFVAALKFFASFGVNLVDSFIDSKIKNIDFKDIDTNVYSFKEVSLDQRFDRVFQKCPKKNELLNEFPCLKVIYNESGRIRLIDLIKKMHKDQHREFIMEYLHSRIIDPEEMILDVNDLANYNTRIDSIKELIEAQIKYIYVDTFYYSLHSYIKMDHGSKFNLQDYLDDLVIKVNCIKDTPLSHRFIDESLLTIEELKENN